MAALVRSRPCLSGDLGCEEGSGAGGGGVGVRGARRHGLNGDLTPH